MWGEEGDVKLMEHIVMNMLHQEITCFLYL